MGKGASMGKEWLEEPWCPSSIAPAWISLNLHSVFDVSQALFSTQVTYPGMYQAPSKQVKQSQREELWLSWFPVPPEVPEDVSHALPDNVFSLSTLSLPVLLQDAFSEATSVTYNLMELEVTKIKLYSV